MHKYRIMGLVLLALVHTPASALLATSAASSTVFLAGTADGIYRSLDSGRTWRKTGMGLLEHTYIGALAQAPHNASVVYASVWNGPLYVSRDAGASWNATNTQPAFGAGDIAVDPTDERRLYTASGGDGMNTSTNSGTTWTHINGALLSSVGTIAVDPRDSTILLAGSNANGALKSTDRGRTWKRTGDFPLHTMYSLAFNPVDPDVAYAATSGGIYETIDAAASWQTSRRGMRGASDFRSVAVDDRNGANIIAGSHAGDIYRSGDGGTNWIHVGNASGFPIYAIAFDPVQSGHVLVGSNFGLMESHDHGATWHSAAALHGHQINVLVAAGHYPRRRPAHTVAAQMLH